MLTTLPALHAVWPLTEGPHAADGIYSGILSDREGRPYLLVALNVEPPKKCLTWRAAMDWAKTLGASLPNRVEAALLKHIGCGLFEPDWYWLSDELGERSAWFQYFYYGGQSISAKSAQLRARAVRRYYLDSFGPLILCVPAMAIAA